MLQWTIYLKSQLLYNQIMVQYIIVGFLGCLSIISMCLFLFIKEGTKGIKAKPYKTKSGIVHTAERSRENHLV